MRPLEGAAAPAADPGSSRLLAPSRPSHGPHRARSLPSMREAVSEASMDPGVPPLARVSRLAHEGRRRRGHRLPLPGYRQGFPRPCGPRRGSWRGQALLCLQPPRTNDALAPVPREGALRRPRVGAPRSRPAPLSMASTNGGSAALPVMSGTHAIEGLEKRDRVTRSSHPPLHSIRGDPFPSHECSSMEGERVTLDRAPAPRTAAPAGSLRPPLSYSTSTSDQHIDRKKAMPR